MLEDVKNYVDETIQMVKANPIPTALVAVGALAVSSFTGIRLFKKRRSKSSIKKAQRTRRRNALRRAYNRGRAARRNYHYHKRR